MSEAITPGQSMPYEAYRKAQDSSKRQYRLRKEAEEKLARLTAEHETLRGKLTDAEKAAKDWETKFLDAPIAERAENERLRKGTRDRDHRDEITKHIGDAKIRPDALEALLKVQAYDPEQFQTADGKPDAAKIKTFLGEAATANPWAVAPETGAQAPNGAQGATTGLTRGAGPGVTRGAAPTVQKPQTVEDIVRARAEVSGLQWGGAPR